MIVQILRLLRNPHRKKSSKRKGAGRKSQAKGIRSLRKRMADHEEKIRREPLSPAVAHWRQEVLHFKAEIAALERRRKDQR